jgi:hypothetical protein
VSVSGAESELVTASTTAIAISKSRKPITPTAPKITAGSTDPSGRAVGLNGVAMGGGRGLADPSTGACRPVLVAEAFGVATAGAGGIALGGGGGPA